ncbi:hypothetical protein [Amycolatopsis thermophila]|uniref:Uncharacterized protein n=1 Tax=Amycolatopsis thermophila TaxID=206084 RepID=A0ABU0EZ93_9PSEU|nr:hypothetical protein [Amycolatopsis thermophila]MDQ0380578.1 hypothetical protein [Amycolatopsis thermophila]
MTHPQPVPPARGRWRLPVAALVAGLVVGGGAVGLVWLGSAAGSPDVETACAIVGRTTRLDPEADYAQYRRWAAAAELAAVAAEQDPRRQALADALRRPIEIVQATFRADGPEFDAAMTRARGACADI